MDWSRRPSSRSDIWSIGVIFAMMLGCECPVNSEDNADDLRDSLIKSRVDLLLSGVSKPAKNLLLRMLQFEPRKRINAHSSQRHKWFI